MRLLLRGGGNFSAGEKVFDLNCLAVLSGRWKLFILLFTLLCLLQVARLVQHSGELKRVQLFFERALKIPTASIESTNISTVFDRIETFQKAHRISIDSLNSHSIVTRIMRFENYAIAFFNHFPAYCTSHSLEWFIEFVLFGFLFEDSSVHKVKKKITKSFYREALADELTLRLKAVAVISAVLAPLLVLYEFFYFVLRYGEEYWMNPTVAASNRAFSRAFKWKMREYNELSHLFEERTAKALPLLNLYLSSKKRQDAHYRIISKLSTFISGVCFILFTLCSLRGESTGEKSIWFFGLSGLVFAATRSFFSSAQHSIQQPSCAQLEMQIQSLTHFAPKEIAFPRKIYLLAKEIQSAFTNAHTLYQLSKREKTLQIVDFLQAATVYSEGVGYLCKYSLLSIPEAGKEKFKLDKSLLTFTQNFPQWQIPQDKAKFIEQLKVEASQKSTLNPEGLDLFNLFCQFYQNNLILERK